MREALLILGNQLFPPNLLPLKAGADVFMAEDLELCTRFKYHKHKIMLFLAAMREYADALTNKKYKVHYSAFDSPSGDNPYIARLEQFLCTHKVSRLHCIEIEDKFFEERVRSLCKTLAIELHEHNSPMFLKTREDFKTYLKSHPRPFMKTFYEEFRRESGVLMGSQGKPLGGKFSFDQENRKKLPRTIKIPPIPNAGSSAHLDKVASIINQKFPSHPGETKDFWLPVNRRDALTWVKDFFENRFSSFGLYEDAISPEHPFIFHSVLSPILNLGLVTPHELLVQAQEHFHRNGIPLNSVEGFVRQVMGWREFVRGIYQNFSDTQDHKNFFGHKRKMNSRWYSGTTGILPVDDAIRKAIRYGYNHHIERLMILSNTMLLSEIAPQEVHRWFMEMYVDSSDWVMGPNVYGMGQFSDGGIFATKPYFCGSNYIRKMSSYPNAEWCDTLDGLYWRFVHRHKNFFRSNPRLSTMVGNLERMSAERKEKIFSAAEGFLKITTSCEE